MLDEETGIRIRDNKLFPRCDDDDVIKFREKNFLFIHQVTTVDRRNLAKNLHR